MPPYGEYQSIDRFHSEIHEGEAYLVRGVSTSVVTGASYSCVIATPSDEEVHMRFGGIGTGEIKMEVYEDVVIDTDLGFGTASYARNHNRRSTETYSGSIWIDPDFDEISSYGTILYSDRVGTGKVVGGETESEQEWILDTSSYYLLTIVAVGNNISISGWMNFYVVDLGR